MTYITDIQWAPKEILERLGHVRHVALDMDGTLYNGKTLFPYTIGFLGKLKGLGLDYSLVTNNASISIADHLEKVASLGIEISGMELYNSAQATIDFIKAKHPEWRRLFILGTSSVTKQFEKNGFAISADDPDDDPDALIVSFDTGLTYSRLCRASWWAKQGKPYFATNTDWVCPTDQSTILVDCGSIFRCIEAATGRKPDKVFGKPQPEMLTRILASKNLEPNQVAVVGDRIYTDMEMAHRSGAFGILVLSGESTLDDAKIANLDIDLIVPSIKELGDLLELV